MSNIPSQPGAYSWLSLAIGDSLSLSDSPLDAFSIFLSQTFWIFRIFIIQYNNRISIENKI